MIEVHKTPISGLVLVQPKVFGDARGSFVESYNEKEWAAAGLPCDFVQDNQSISSRGVFRGLHFQKGKYSQTKVIRVIKGKILDIVVDLRPGSATFKQLFSAVLDENGRHMVVPKNFAHGFLVLSEMATVAYKCDEYYSPQYDAGINPLDPDLNIDWPMPVEELTLSEKDRKLPAFKTVLERRDWELK